MPLSLEEGLAEYRRQMMEAGAAFYQDAGPALVTFRPLESQALGVHPDQIPEAIETAKALGVPTRFTKTGEPIFTSSRHFRQYARRHGYRHRGYA